MGVSIDTGSPQDNFTLQILGAMAEFERSLIRERTKAGVRDAKALGRLPSDPGLISGDPLTRRRRRGRRVPAHRAEPATDSAVGPRCQRAVNTAMKKRLRGNPAPWTSDGTTHRVHGILPRNEHIISHGKGASKSSPMLIWP